MVLVPCGPISSKFGRCRSVLDGRKLLNATWVYCVLKENSQICFQQSVLKENMALRAGAEGIAAGEMGSSQQLPLMTDVLIAVAIKEKQQHPHVMSWRQRFAGRCAPVSKPFGSGQLPVGTARWCTE